MGAGPEIARRDGGCTWRGLIMDTNSPDDDHWWYKLAEEKVPPGWKESDGVPDLRGWKFFVQPGGMFEDTDGTFHVNPKAENLDNLEPDFYEERAQGKNKDHIRVYYCNRYGFIGFGKPCYPEYADEVHCAKYELRLDRARPVIVGIDFGLTPAAAFMQQDVLGRWSAVDELVTEDMGATKFAKEFKVKVNQNFRDCELIIYGDPAGEDRAQTDESTPFQILHGQGIMVMPAPSNDLTIRHDAVAQHMRVWNEGRPGFLISPKCKVMRKGFAGGYCLRRLLVSGEERYQEKPLKNRYSHVVEACEYAMLGYGEGASVLGLPEEDEDDHDEAWVDYGRDQVTGY